MVGMLWLLAAHLVGVAVAILAGGRLGMRPGLAAAAAAPGATAVWATAKLLNHSEPTVEELVWVEGLQLGLRFRSDSMALMMTLLVSGIGLAVFIYAIGYFSVNAQGAVRFPSSLLAFSTSMLGLVWADSVWTLFIFWELTSVTSFLLVGHRNVDAAVRTAARRALMITGAGGLALLAGLLILENEAGTATLTDLPAVSGTGATVAAILIMVGAATKSAQVPFHVWLPGAMAAPTPVSAYLHSATMVKAGVLLIAVTGTAFADVTIWKVAGLCFGIGSMLWGGIGALRHRDAKLILAWGTVSQLGLLVTLLAAGSGKAVFAATSILFAHALFKAALFAVVGEIDIRTGTRDITELSGLYRTMPVATVVAVLAGASMAGVPPLLGFAAKEAAVEAVLGLSGFEALVVGAAVIGGSTLTVAYTVRFLICVFGPGPDPADNTVVAPPRPAMAVPAVVLGGAGLLGFIFLHPVNEIVVPAAVELNAKASVYELHRWPGITTGLLISFGIVAVGWALGLYLASQAVPRLPRPIGADAADDMIDGVLEKSPRLIGRIQHGSLPVYLVTMTAIAALATVPLLTDLSIDHLVLWDQPLQGVLAASLVISAVAGVFVGSRLGAALTLGAVGIAVSGLFVLHGAPDLALTQLLVETVVVVGFVIGLGHLARRFPSAQPAWRVVRVGVSGAIGLGVALALAAAGSDPKGSAPIQELADGSVDVGGGNNIVNVILTDIRALDTVGEVVVLAVVAVGILALANVRKTEAGNEAPA